MEGKKPYPPFPWSRQMVRTLFEFLSRKGPSRGKLRSEPHVLPLLKACHVQALNSNLTNTFSIPKLLGDILYFLKTSACCNAKLCCTACLHFFTPSTFLHMLKGITTRKMNPAENIPPATVYQQKIHTAAPDVGEQIPLKGKKEILKREKK